MTRFYFQTAFLIIFCVLSTQKSYCAEPVSEPPITFEKLQSFIEARNALPDKSKHIFSKVDLINALPESMFRGRLLAHRSHSPAEPFVDALHPRAIAFDEDANFIISVTSDETKNPRSHDVEFAEWDPSPGGKYLYKPHRITFPTHAGDSINYEKNPTSCQECHGKPYKLIWDPLVPVMPWPDFFGSEFDHVFLDSVELQKWKKFEEHAANTPLYHRFNKKLDTTTPSPPQYGEQTYGFDTEHSIGNMGFGGLVEYKNSLRIFYELSSLPEFEKYKFAIAGAMQGCDDLPLFLPAKERQGRREFDSYVQDTYEKMLDQAKFRLREAGLKEKSVDLLDLYKNLALVPIDENYEENPKLKRINSRLDKELPGNDQTDNGHITPYRMSYLASFETSSSNQIAGLRYLLEDSLKKSGTPISHWSLARDRGTYAFAERFFGILSSGANFISRYYEVNEKFPKRIADFKNLPTGADRATPTCESLREASLRSFGTKENEIKQIHQQLEKNIAARSVAKVAATQPSAVTDSQAVNSGTHGVVQPISIKLGSQALEGQRIVRQYCISCHPSNADPDFRTDEAIAKALAEDHSVLETGMRPLDQTAQPHNF